MKPSRFTIPRHPEHQYLDLLRELLDAPGRETRNDTATRSVFGRQMRFDLARGFPLLTTKKLPFRVIAAELLWFLSGSTNAKVLEDQGINIWKQWKRPYNLDRKIELVDVRPRSYVSYHGDFRTTGLGGNKGDERYELSQLWVRMMRRCYDRTHHRYRFYGAKGVSVAKDWHDPQTFVRDARKLPHWEYKKENWTDFDLDKDYYGSNQYGPTTCAWLREDENCQYTTAAVPIVITRPDGQTSFHLSIHDAVRKTGWASSSLRRYLKDGPLSSYKQGNKVYENWSAHEVTFGEKLPRFALILDREMGPIYGKQMRGDGSPGAIDQIALMLQGLRDDPHGRRHVMTLWNPADLPDMALPPCHGIAIQFYVGADERLSLFMHQRSADAFLGLPFNIASYAMLLLMFARALDRHPGEFIWSGGDCHLYANHIEQARQQVLREPRPLPTLDVARRGDLDTWTLGDFSLRDYAPWPHIVAEVSA